MSAPPIADIAKDLVTLCRQGKFLEAVKKHYGNAIVSVESVSTPTMPAELKGIEAVTQKNKSWLENHKVHSAEVNGPYVGEHRFAVEYKFDVTPKGSDKRRVMQEVAVYTVQNGKIVHEHFFYSGV
jgi:hypothetical protein